METLGGSRALQSPGSFSGRASRSLVGVLLFALAVRFFVVYALPFLVDVSPDHFGGLWPRRRWLVGHIVCGGLALLVGPFQFWSGLRRRFMLIHRWTGRLYLVGVLAGGSAAFYLVSQTERGALFGLSLGAQGVAWWVTSGLAYLAIQRGDVRRHKEWVVRSYIVTLAFVTFRGSEELGILRILGRQPVIALIWLSWTVPLLAAELFIQRRNVTARRLALSNQRLTCRRRGNIGQSERSLSGRRK